jgi:hypothetical protein
MTISYISVRTDFLYFLLHDLSTEVSNGACGNELIRVCERLPDVILLLWMKHEMIVDE